MFTTIIDSDRATLQADGTYQAEFLVRIREQAEREGQGQ